MNRPVRSVRLLGSLILAALGFTFGCEGGDSDSGGSGAAAGSGGASGGTSGTGAAPMTGGTGGAGATGGGTLGGAGGIGGGSGGGTGATPSGGAGGSVAPPAELQATVRVTEERQVVDGFGMSTAWGSVPDDDDLDAFFSTTRGAGFSIVRNRIPFREAPQFDDNFMGGGNYDYVVHGAGTANEYKTFTLNFNTWDLSATRTLIGKLEANPDYDVRSYFSTPWTPPNNATSRWKLGVADYANAPEVGGYLDPAHYADYADVLADYALGFESHMGVPLAALSLQNEPNYQVSYESADWSADQFHDFIAVLAAEFEKKGVFTALPDLKIMAPEDPNFVETLILPTLADPTTSAVLGMVGAHQYEFGPWNVANYAPEPLTQSVAAGKPVWMTEWSTAAFDDRTPIERALLLGRLIHMDFTQANLNAFVYWWTDSLVDDAGTPNKELWTLAQFSRFVRPGWVRLESPAAVEPGVLLTAFANPTGDQASFVVVNESDAASTFALTLDGGTFGEVRAYRTSATEDMADAGTLSGGQAYVNVTVPENSIMTFVGPVVR